MGADLHIPDLQHIVQGIPVECALCDDGDHGHAQLLHENSQLPGQGSGSAVEGIASLRVHEHIGLIDLQHILQVMDQGQIGDVLVGGSTAQQPHQLAQDAGHAVHAGDDTHGLGIENTVGQLHIGEARVIHQDQTGLIAYLLHILGGIGKFGLHEGGDGSDPHHSGQPGCRLAGRLMPQTGLLQNLFIGHIDGVDLHKCSPVECCLMTFYHSRRKKAICE